jgi:aminomethyltransferase
MPERTPLYEEHLRLGGKMVDFAGWELPVSYPGGILSEHKSTRGGAGMFDVSHMGEMIVSGVGAYEFLQDLLTNDISRTRKGRAVYSPMCYENGGTVDDLIVYPQGDLFFVVVNAANTKKDYEWILSRVPSGVKVENLSDQFAQIALQGPDAARILRAAGAPEEAAALPFFGCGSFNINGSGAFVSATGYTGERGFEIYLPCAEAPALWKALIESGAVPAGLGARDTLRFEACLPLYGHELSPAISPLEAGLDRFVKLDKPSFTGRDALAAQAENGLARRLTGLEIKSKAIARAGAVILSDGKECGYVTSGSFCPTLGRNMALALISTGAQGSFEAVVHGKTEPAIPAAIPFYSRPR